MKTTLVVLLATLILAVVLGPRALDALQSQSATSTSAPSASLDAGDSPSAATVATILNADGTVASSPGNDSLSASPQNDDDEDDDEDEDHDD
jgi:hypothetical protein